MIIRVYKRKKKEKKSLKKKKEKKKKKKKKKTDATCWNSDGLRIPALRKKNKKGARGIKEDTFLW